MAEVGGYSLDLYCDGPTCARDEPFPRFRERMVGNFCAQTIGEVRRMARDAGWRRARDLAPTEGTKPAWRCPRCVREQAEAKQLQRTQR